MTMSPRKFALVFAVVSLVALPVIALASTGGTYTTPSLWPTGYWGPLVSCTGNYLASGATYNPGQGACTSLCDLINTGINIVYFAMSVAIFIIAPILFIVGGILMMISGANPEMLSKGRKTLTDTVIGVVIVLCSYLIVNTIITTLQINGIGGFGAGSCALGTVQSGTGSTGGTGTAGSTNLPEGGSCTTGDQCATGVCVIAADGTGSCGPAPSSGSGIQSPGEGVVGGSLNPGWIPCGNTQCDPNSRFPTCAVNKDGSKYCAP